MKDNEGEKHRRDDRRAPVLLVLYNIKVKRLYCYFFAMDSFVFKSIAYMYLLDT